MFLLKPCSKILTKVGDYTFKGSFEGWMKKIVVNECLMHLRKPIQKTHTRDIMEYDAVEDQTIIDRLMADDILRLLDELPTGYRTIFNLYVVESYKHKEIAEMLGISINTSKSQLLLAKKKMRELIIQHYGTKRSS